MTYQVLRSELPAMDGCDYVDTEAYDHPFTSLRFAMTDGEYSSNLYNGFDGIVKHMDSQHIVNTVKKCSMKSSDKIQYKSFNNLLEFITTILDLKTSDAPHYKTSPVYDHILAMGTLIVERYCALYGRNKSLQCWGGTDHPYLVTVNHSRAGSKGIMDCIVHSLCLQHIEPTRHVST